MGSEMVPLKNKPVAVKDVAKKAAKPTNVSAPATDYSAVARGPDRLADISGSLAEGQPSGAVKGEAGQKSAAEGARSLGKFHLKRTGEGDEIHVESFSFVIRTFEHAAGFFDLWCRGIQTMQSNGLKSAKASEFVEFMTGWIAAYRAQPDERVGPGTFYLCAASVGL